MDDFGESLQRVIAIILQQLCNIAFSMFIRVAESPIVAKITSKPCHISELGTKVMVQKLTNTRPYAQPLSSIPVNEECHALPSDFVVGLTFLRPLIKSRGNRFETPLIEVYIDRVGRCFQWHDDPEFLVHDSQLSRPGSTHRQMAVDAFLLTTATSTKGLW